MKPYYDDGAVTIYHGDALNVLPQLSGYADLVVTDPPYFQPAAHYVGPRADPPRKAIGDMSILEFVFKTWCDEMMRHLVSNGNVYFFCDGQSYPRSPRSTRTPSTSVPWSGTRLSRTTATRGGTSTNSSLGLSDPQRSACQQAMATFSAIVPCQSASVCTRLRSRFHFLARSSPSTRTRP
jgi:hypothetical protein